MLSRSGAWGSCVTTAAISCLLLGTPAAAAPSLTSKPAPVALTGEATPIELEVRGLIGSGAAHAAVNVGSVAEVREESGVVRVRYLLPEPRYPQLLCLLLWRGSGETVALRLPMLGSTVVPVKTRANSVITVAVGGRLFGPHETGRFGRRKVRLLVPPGVEEARVKVKDRVGLESEKKIPIKHPAYNLLALAATGAGELAVASADPRKGTPELELGGARLALTSVAPGLWTARTAARGRQLARARLPGQTASVRESEVELGRPAVAPVAEKTPNVDAGQLRAAAPPPRRERRLEAVLGVGVGFLHNTGALVSPRFSLSAGLDVRLPVGWLGLRALAGVSWASHNETLPLGDASSSVLLIPLGGELTYRIPTRVLTPYVAAGCVAQLVRTVNRLAADERVRHDVAVGALGVGGAERQVGPGWIYLEAGYQWSRVENVDVKLLAGGVVLEAGYRFRL